MHTRSGAAEGRRIMAGRINVSTLPSMCVCVVWRVLSFSTVFFRLGRWRGPICISLAFFPRSPQREKEKERRTVCAICFGGICVCVCMCAVIEIFDGFISAGYQFLWASCLFFMYLSVIKGEFCKNIDPNYRNENDDDKFIEVLWERCMCV